MKKTFTLTIVLTLLFAFNVIGQTNHYYHSPRGKERINLSTQKILIKFIEGVSVDRQALILSTEKGIAPLSADMQLPAPKVVLANLENTPTEAQVWDILNNLNKHNEVAYANPVFVYADGTLQAVQEYVIVRLKTQADEEMLRNIARSYNLDMIKQNEFDTQTYHLGTTKATNGNALTVANELYETGVFDYVEPDFLRFMKKMMPNDPALDEQWSLNNTGQYNGTPAADMRIFDAWMQQTGNASIKVAILDEGVDINHPDLLANLEAGYDATGQGSAGAPSGNDAHGTACAGIVGAVGNNGLGMAGIAYGSRIVPVRIAYTSADEWVTSNTWIGNAINWSWQNAGADILSNSWGGGGSSFTIDAAINNAVANGRNGLGAPVLFAAGNDNAAVSYPATNTNTIAVGATSMCDERKSPSSCDGETWWGSNFGEGIDVAAPGAKIYATDISGSAGYSGGDFVTGFNGTSSATPNAAGVMALILSANENLTEQQARFALESTCDKVGNYSYQTGVSGQPTGAWSNEIGYGRVNAMAAIAAVAPSRSDDAGIMLIESPNDEAICANSIEPVVVLRNNGVNVLTNVKINYQVDNSTTHTYNWVGSLSGTQNTQVTLPNIPVNDGVHILNVFTSNPNGQTDTNVSNDGTAATFSSGSQQLTLRITLDNYGTETSWKIKDANGNVLQEGGPYQDNAVNSEVTEFICLPAGCFDFIMYDAYGDGMCCGYGNGAFRLTEDATGDVLASGGQYGSQDLTNFCLENQTPTTPLSVELTKLSDVLCYGGNEGRVKANVEGGVLPYIYTWSADAIGETANNLSAGIYTLKVEDAEGQIVTRNITITQPDVLGLTMIQSPAENGNNGYAAVEVEGGTNPYEYAWNNGASTPGISGVSSGTYGVTVVDANGCSKIGTVAVESIDTPALEARIVSFTNVTCHGGQNGTAIAEATGGFPPYTYVWNNQQNGADATGFGAGYARVVVIDSEGNQATAQETITEPTAISANIVATTAMDGNNGAADLMVSGGTGSYTYEWSNGETTEDINNIAGGEYSVTIYDAKGCEKTASVFIEEINTPTLVASITSFTNVSCNGGDDGRASAAATGGFPPYTYVWNNQANGANATGFEAGYARVVVIDSEGNQATAQETITEPTAIVTSITSTEAVNGNNGSANLTVSGGVAPYTYEWSNGATTEDINNLAGGEYFVIIRDANDCEFTDVVVIEEINTPELTVNIIAYTDVTCHDGQDGTANAEATGGFPPYTYIWNNQQNGTSASGFAAGYAQVAVIDSEGNQAVAQATISEPEALVLTLSMVDANNGNNGSIDLSVSGGTAPYTYEWSNGSTSANLDNLEAGFYELLVTDANACTETATATIEDVTPIEESDLKFEHGLLTAVSENWETITVENSYTSMVVIASVRMPHGDAQPVVARVRNTVNNSFDIKIQIPGTRTTETYDIDYMVIEEGVYNVEDHGVKMEAVKANAGETARSGSWKREARTYHNQYEKPVVLGQVMTANNEAWSVFWASTSTSRSKAPTATSFAAGKNVAEDTNQNRVDEMIGYLVLEEGQGNINGLNFYAGLSDDIIKGLPNTGGEGVTYEIDGLLGATVAVVSTAGMDGNNGGWPSLLNANPVSHRQINLTFDEDQIKDNERSHTTEQAAFIVFEDLDAQPEPVQEIAFEQGVLENISGEWTTIQLENTYNSMVVVATVVQTATDDEAVVTRIRNANDNSFQIKVQATSTSGLVNSTYSIHYMVAEEGIYTIAEHGVSMEVAKVNSTQTSARNIWKYEYQSYQNDYSQPVVFGQVMTYNDSDWSVFWSSNGYRKNPATANSIAIGKHVGEDTDRTRSNEILGYIVMEQGVGFINGMEFIAGLGADIVMGIGGSNGTDIRYDIEGAEAGHTAVLSAAGMDGSDCGWPILYGENPVSDGQLALAFDEDQMKDEERAHTTEQVSYVVFNATNSNGNFAANNNLEQFGGNDTPTTYLSLYPNPTVDIINIQHEFTSSGDAQIMINDMMGRTVMQESLFIEKETVRNIQMDVQDLEVGHYIISIISDDEPTTEQFIKTK